MKRIIILLILLFCCGCIEQRNVTGFGTEITLFEPDFKQIESGEQVELFLDIENIGNSKATNVCAFLYGLIFGASKNDWKLKTNELQCISDLDGVDALTNTPGDIGFVSWLIEAPSIDYKHSYDAKVRLFYSYKTTAATSISFINKEVKRQMEQSGKELPKQSEVKLSNSPIAVDIITDSPVVSGTDNDFVVKVKIENAGSGSVFNASAEYTEISSNDLNWLKMKVSSPGLEQIDCPCFNKYCDIRLRSFGETIHNCELKTPTVETTDYKPVLVELEYGYYTDGSTTLTVLAEE